MRDPYGVWPHGAHAITPTPLRHCVYGEAGIAKQSIWSQACPHASPCPEFLDAMCVIPAGSDFELGLVWFASVLVWCGLGLVIDISVKGVCVGLGLQALGPPDRHIAVTFVNGSARLGPAAQDIGADRFRRSSWPCRTPEPDGAGSAE